MSEQALINLSEKIKIIGKKCESKEITLKIAQRDISDALNTLVNQYSQHIKKEQMCLIYELITQLVFSSNIEVFISKLDELNNVLKNIVDEMLIKCNSVNWFEEVKKRVQNNDMFASELMVPDVLEYDKRIEIFNKYILNEIKCNENSNKEEIMETIRKLIIILFLPIHTKSTKINKTNIKITFHCNHSGKTKESCKGRSCLYKLYVTLGFDEKNCIVENGTHNHSLDYFFVISKTCPILKQEKQLIPKTKKEFVEFVANHPNIHISLKKFRQIQKVEDKSQILESTFLSELFVENESFVKLTNTFTNNCIHSILFIHKKVAQIEYSKRKWYIDDTSNINVYNKNVLAIIVKDDNSFNQLLAFGFLFDQTQNSFELLLNQLHNVLNYSPDVIICDRCVAQFNALSTIFPSSKIFFCRVHVERSLLKYFKSDDVIMKMYYLMINMKLDEDDFINVWNNIIKNNNRNNIEDEEDFEESTEESSEEERTIDELLEQDRSDIINAEDSRYELSDNIKELLKKANNVSIKKGLLCLISLIEQRDNWIPSECIKYGMYRDITTNRVEGFFGHLKNMINHERLPLFQLTNNICALANTMFNNITSIELPDGIINKNDPLFDSLTEFAKRILKSQYELLNNNLYYENQYCISCEIRRVNSKLSWPCCHLMKEMKMKRTREFILDYNDLPSFAFKSKQFQMNWSNKCITNIELPNDYTLKENVVINKLEHNTNCRPRNKVEFKKRKSKDVIFSEIEPCKLKKGLSDSESAQIKMKKSLIDLENISNIDKNEIINQHNIEENTSITESFQEELSINEISNYNINLTIEQFEKIMKTFNIPSNCMLCGISKNNDVFQLPHNIENYETIVFPFISKNKYGIISYVNRIKISNGERSKCLIYIKHGKIECPSFMKRINKQLINELKLDKEPIIHSIHIDKYIEEFKFNGYFMLFILQCFIMKRKDDISRQSKKLDEYIVLDNMIESFKKYNEILSTY